ncbi:cupin [Planococcus shixiaomingii]|uniref:cupin n=1 Tax=Planococcus shixiaomingii TaxID=3058393 RepID=UPI002602F199|nr:cupin [Planococcus sp. N022]WKA56555.1 cupin [Planococcus sp. N022]
MKVYTFEKESGKHITAFNSSFVMTRIARTESATHVGMVFLEPGETIGFHKAVVPQLLLVIEGEGWVRSDMHQKRLIKKGEAVSWTKGEGHETTTESGLTALVIEAEDLLLNNFHGFMKI